MNLLKNNLIIIKKKFLYYFNNIFLNKFNYNLFPNVNHFRIKNLINSIKIYNLGYELIRLGPEGDGGYLIPNVLSEIDTCFSPGVGKINGFENDIMKRNIKVFMADNTVEKPILLNDNYEFLKKNLGSYADEQTITLDEWINNTKVNKGILIQMDIEGSEYEVINNLTEENLKKIKVMIIEFHHFDQVITKIGYKVIENVLKKILKYFDVAHIHPNNCCENLKMDKIIIPSTLEITFLNKKLTLKKDKINDLPHKLDFKNIQEHDDIFLDKSWYS
jgi:hypothetical protein